MLIGLQYRLVLLSLLCMAAVVSCGRGLSFQSECVPAEIQGDWVICTGGGGQSARMVVSIACQQTVVTIASYDDNACQGNQQVQWTYTNEVTAAAATGGWNLDSVTTQYKITPITAPVATYLSGLAACGYTGWTAGQEVDIYAIEGIALPDDSCLDSFPVTAQGSYDYNYAARVGSRLCFGEAVTTATARPTTTSSCLDPL